MPTLEEQIQALNEQLNSQPAPVLPQLPRQSRDDGGGGGWTGLLGDVGEVLSGGQSPTYRLRGSERAAAGSRALLNFGINMLMASGPQRVRPDLGSVFGAGLQGAQQSMDLDQRRAQAVAQQDYSQRMELAKLGVEQNRDRIERLKALIPLLQLQQRGQPLPGDTSVGTGGATTATAPGGGYGQLLTGDIEHDEPIIRQRESGGKPDALNYVARADPSMRAKGATASGLYGFVDRTWKEGLAMVGGDAAKYPTADSAPENLQREVFRAVYKARGTAPWDSRTWGQNWVQGPDGKYTLVATPKGTAARTGGTDVAGPPGTVPARTPPPVATTTAQPPPATAPAAPVAVEPETGLPIVASPGAALAPAAQRPPEQPAGPAPGSFEAYLKDHATHLQPSPEVQASFAAAPDAEQLANIQTQRRETQAALKDAYERYRRGDKDVDVAGPRLKLAELTQQENTLRETARDKGRQLEKEWREARQKELFDAWTAQNTAATGETKAQADHRRALQLKEIERQNTIATADNAAANTRKTKALEGLDADVKTTGDRMASFDVLRTLSRQVDGSQAISAINIQGTPLVDILAAARWGSPETLRTYGVIQAYRAAASLAVKEVKEGMSMGSMTDRDLTFIENMIPRLAQDTFTREIGISLLEAAQRRKRDIALKASDLIGGGMAPAEAYQKAQEQAPRIIADVPPAVKAMASEQRAQWFHDNVRPGQAFRRPDGKVDIYFGDEQPPPGWTNLTDLKRGQ